VKELVTPVWFETVPQLTPADFQALAAMPLDSLQAWLRDHVLCGGSEGDTLTLEPSACHEDGSCVVVGRCPWCGTSTELTIDAGRWPAFEWWAALMAHIVVAYASVLLPGGRVDCDVYQRCVHTLETAIRLCTLLDEAGKADITH
jgi:hypothetical protein